MPAESANGRFASKAIAKQPMAEASAVAVKTAPPSMPVLPSRFGLTARMYAMVMKVVIPAINSVRTLL